MKKEKQKKNGFTLVEILVVVLIIGILTSVALPQYQKAVLKSRFAQAKIMARAIADAEEVYYSTYNTYTPNIEELDISLATTGASNCWQAGVCEIPFSWGNCSIVAWGENNRNEVQCNIRQNGLNYLIYFLAFNNSNWLPNEALCIAYGRGAHPTPADMTYQICKSEARESTAFSFGGEVLAMKY